MNISELLEIESKLLDDYREEKQIQKPSEFEKGRIDTVLIEKLLPMVSLPFDEKAINITNGTGFKAKGVKISLQENRLQQIFGNSHIKIEYSIIDERYAEGDNVVDAEEHLNDISDDEKKQQQSKTKKGMYYSRVKVDVKIGNYTYYTDTNGKPDTNFVTYYQEEGIGFGGGVTEGSALKNAIDNGKKDAFANMGMLRYLYLDINDKENKNNGLGDSANVVLIENPMFFDSGTMFMKCKAKDIDKNKEITLVVYRENKYNAEEHRKMVKMLSGNKSGLHQNKELSIIYKYSNWHGADQYLVNGIVTNNKNR